MTARLAFPERGSLDVFEAIGRPVWLFDVERHCMWWGNAAALRFWSSETVEDLIARDFSDDGETVRERLRLIVDHTLPGQSAHDVWTLYPYGKPALVDLNMTPVLIGADRRDGVLIETSSSDTSVLEEEERRLVEAVRHTATMISYVRMSGELISMNPAAAQRYGVAPRALEDAVADRPAAFQSRFLHPEEADGLLALCRRGAEARGEFEVQTTAGRCWHQVVLRTTRDPVSGERIVLAVEDDVTLRKKALQDLEALNASLEQRVAERTAAVTESNRKLSSLLEQLRLLIDNLPVMIAYVDAEQRLRLSNRMHAAWFGLEPEQVVGRRKAELQGADYATIEPQVRRVLAGEAVEFELSARGDRQLHTRYVPHRNESGQVLGYFVLVEDITEKRLLEEQLNHSQRLTAIGQLTGGIAHDFNNLLGVIMGNADILASQLPEGQREVSAIIRGAERGAELTQRLLAFSRRQNLVPKAVELPGLLARVEAMLDRTLGETVTVQSVCVEEVWPVSVDPGQLENALLNLAINARDAMPEGGLLALSCSNYGHRPGQAAAGGGEAEHLEMPPGDYVILSVRDSGSGMAAQTRARAFEPFFTTKDVGAGSGLGLSMVYGFVKQSGGDVAIASEEGSGTTVKLYLPRAGMGLAEAPRESIPDDLPKGRGERILVIEDNAQMRALAVQMLEGLGYLAVAAAEPAEARGLLAEGAAFDLVLSDVVLPGGVSGPAFARELADSHPGLTVIFMSGYTALEGTPQAGLGKDAVLIAKPFRRRALARALRQAFS